MEKIQILEDNVRNRYMSVVWSHKIQEKQADIYAKRFSQLETIKILAASLTSIGIVALIFKDAMWLRILSALISFCSVFISAYFKSFNLQEMVGLHKNAANKLIPLRDKFQMLLMKIKCQDGGYDELCAQFQKLMDDLDTLYTEVPSTTDAAVEQARIALKITKDNNFSTAEIDSCLPDSLRRGTK